MGNNFLSKFERELRIRKYSRKTVKAYMLCLKKYFDFKKESLGQFDENNIKDFLYSLEKKKLSGSTINLHLNAIRFFFKNIVKIDSRLDIKFAKTPQKLPVAFTKNEIAKLLISVNNKKHRLILGLSYGAGLRISEVINLKLSDLDIKTRKIHLKSSKGDKDRITVIPERMIDAIQKISTDKKKKAYLFESNRGGKLASRTVQQVFTNALKESGIEKEASFHSLRHSFATHLLESGTDVRYIQELLGHANIRTTQVYTKVTNASLEKVKSPLD